MRPSVLAFLPALLVILALPTHSIAQYMFLDSNGDGLPTAADVVSPTGPTSIDVWIRTNTNRDGSPASCPSADGELTISSYEFILHATNGTLTWSGFVNRQSGMSVNLGEGSSSTDYHNGFAGGAVLTPGAYRLATLTVEITSGTPSISIEAATPVSGPFLTAFGSRCSGSDFDNILKLGSDWFDTDGLEYGGAANLPPSLLQPADMTVAEGTVQDQALSATDADGNPITFALASGPAYVSVTTVDPGTGTASGRLRAAPGFRDAGTATVQVEASDGLRTDRKALTIVVTEVNGAPTMTPLGDVTLSEGQFIDRPLSASDPEGDPVTFSLAAGPRYVSVLSFVGQPPLGRVRVAPRFADAGTGTATVSASDGVLTDQKSFHVTVTDPYPVHNQILCQPAGMLVPAGSVASQALSAVSPDGQPVTFLKQSGPDFVSVTTVSSAPSAATGRVTVAPGPSEVGAFTAVVAATDGIATDPHSFTVTVGDARSLPPAARLYDASTFTSEVGLTPQSLAAADLDGDGVLDLVTANLSHSLSILRGNGDGTFDRREDFPVGETPYSATTADLNHDGRPDIVLVDSTLDVVSIIDATGGCTFGHRRDYQTGNRPAHVKVGDWNADGELDLAVADERDDTISILMGVGDGTFGPRTAYSIGRDPCYSDAGDLNGDGHLDLVTANELSNDLSVLLGNGDGTFRESIPYPAGSNPRSLKIGDFNGDGLLDVVAANFWAASVSLLLGNGDGTLRGQAQFETGHGPWSIAIGDLNADGRLDAVTADVSESSVSLLLGDGSGSFAPRIRLPAGYLARFVVLGDANRDGRLDILVSSEGGNNVVAMLSDGRGGFGAGDPYRVGAGPTATVAGDWNGDGRNDLAALTLEGRTISVQLGRGDGTLAPGQEISLAADPGDLKAGDWNRDGKVDLAVTLRRGADLFATYFGRGDGTFAFGAAYPGLNDFARMESGDLNADGQADLILSNFPSNTLSVFLGETGGTFRAEEPIALPGVPLGHDLGDMNGDGLLDLAVALQGPDEIGIYFGDGSGALVPGAPIMADPFFFVSSPLLADLDRDGTLDLAFCEVNQYAFAGGHTLRVARGRGDGTFGPPAAIGITGNPGGLVAIDANGDGRTDLAVIHEGSGIALFLGLGNGEFAPKMDFGIGTNLAGVTAVDLTGDGRLDLVLSAFTSDRLVVLLNRGTFTPVGNRPPTAEAGGPYAGGVDVPVYFDGRGSSDPDGDALTMSWDFGDGTSGVGAEPAHTYRAEGVFQVSLRASDGFLSATDVATATISGILPARAFTSPENSVIRLSTGRAAAYIQLEPVDGSFQLESVDLSSVVLHSQGTGSVEEIHTVAGKKADARDRDRNGVPELSLGFSRDDLRLLFESVTGRRTLSVALEGTVLTGGTRFHTECQVEVQGASNFPSVTVAPNPMNPATVLTVQISRRGRLRAAIFDAGGRLVRLLTDQPDAPPGFREMRFDGRAQGGAVLASGVYFYRVESVEGIAEGRIVMVR